MIESITQHCLEAYMKRTGSKKVIHSLNKIEKAANFGVPIGKNRYYFDGLIVVIKNKVAKTCYKPRGGQLLSIYNAFNAKTPPAIN